jgi:hypothetical protein
MRSSFILGASALCLVLCAVIPSSVFAETEAAAHVPPTVVSGADGSESIQSILNHWTPQALMSAISLDNVNIPFTADGPLNFTEGDFYPSTAAGAFSDLDLLPRDFVAHFFLVASIFRQWSSCFS